MSQSRVPVNLDAEMELLRRCRKSLVLRVKGPPMASVKALTQKVSRFRRYGEPSPLCGWARGIAQGRTEFPLRVPSPAVMTPGPKAVMAHRTPKILLPRFDPFPELGSGVYDEFSMTLPIDEC